MWRTTLPPRTRWTTNVRPTTTTEYTEALPLSTKGVIYATKEGSEENRTTNMTTTQQYQSAASETSGGGGFDGTRSKASKEDWKLALIGLVAFVLVAGSVGLVGYFVVKKRKRSNNAGVYFQNLTYGVNRDDQQPRQSVRLLQVDQQVEVQPPQSSLAADKPPEKVKKDDKNVEIDSESSLLGGKKTMTEGNDLSAQEESEMTSLNTDDDESSKCESSDNDTNKISSEKDMT